MKKQFYVSISMMGSHLKEVRYRKENKGEIFSAPCHFPSIPMLEWSILGNEDVEIIAFMTDDDNGLSESNYSLFCEELEKLSKEIGRELKVNRKVVLPHREDRSKQIELFKSVCSTFEENAEIYMDITYGTKVTSVGLFSALTYAEKIKHCTIKSIYYGKYTFGEEAIGDIYDVRCLYELSAIIHALDFADSERMEDIINDLWG